MSVMEMSHRSKPFETILEKTIADLSTLMGIPENYRVLFVQGGASLQFSMVPMNFLSPGKVADYLVTGAWGKKALESGNLVGESKIVFDDKPNQYRNVPTEAPATSPNAAYVHYTSNETIQGVQFPSDLTYSAPAVCDMSSDILSRPVDVNAYSMIYAGAQKNMGPAGVTLVVAKDEFLAQGASGLAPMLDYRVQSENDSLYNTPATFAIYVCGLVYRHLLDRGGLPAVALRNQEKAGLLYAAIDQSGGFYRGHAAVEARSNMNVTFTLPSDELTNAFLKETVSAGLDGLKGHRSVGGVRASIYNAFPVEGCQTLAEAMRDFARRHG